MKLEEEVILVLELKAFPIFLFSLKIKKKKKKAIIKFIKKKKKK